MRVRSLLAALLPLLVLALVGLALLRSPPSVGVEPMPPATNDALTILFFGDSGSATPLQRRVADSMAVVCRRLACDFGLMLGDNVYTSRPLLGPQDPVLEDSIGRPYSALGDRDGFALWMVMGNHDVLAGLEAQLAYAAQQRLLQPAALVFAVPKLPEWLHLFGLFTPTLFKADGVVEVADPAADWRAQQQRVEDFFCDQSKRGWKILFGHHPLYASAHGTAQRLASRLLPVIRRCGVDLYLSGHAHQQEHIHTEDIDQFIQGAASSPRPARGWFKDAPAPRFSSEQPGFAVLRINAREAWVVFFDAEGQPIYSWRANRSDTALDDERHSDADR